MLLFRNFIKLLNLTKFERQSRQIGSILTQVKSSESVLRNEPMLTYLKSSPERILLEDQLERNASKCEEIPIIIGSKEFRTEDIRYQVMPHNHSHKIAKFYHADQKLIELAINSAVKAQTKWDRVNIRDRLTIWEKAADLMAGKFRQELNAATMLGQSKTVIQAEIDSAAELIDFFRINAYFLNEAIKYQPISDNISVTKNSMRYRGIDGFVAAISPFNFTAIGGNLAYTPALLGNSVLWKPSDAAILSNWLIFKVMREAGLPDGVVNFIPAEGPVFGDAITKSKFLAGVNFTGSVPTFNWLWRQIGENIDNYRNFPRLIGECGGKNYHFVHPSAEVDTVVTATIRSAFEYCGQKCSACSRMYVPKTLWPKILDRLIEEHHKLRFGDVSDFTVFGGAVIDEKAFKRITNYIEHAKISKNLKILAGGQYSDKKGYFVDPTIVQTTDPKDKIMTEEIFGPILSVYVYKDENLKETMELVNSSTNFALTGAVFGQDEHFLKEALEEFKMSAGNFYINDKSTGSVVGQQPFGGGRKSGTNDKAGGPHYILRWTTPQSIKETFVPLKDIDYPYMKSM